MSAWSDNTAPSSAPDPSDSASFYEDPDGYVDDGHYPWCQCACCRAKRRDKMYPRGEDL